jgi:hypothetical protein
MSSVPVIGNSLYKFYNVIDQEYIQFAYIVKGANVDSFYNTLDTNKSTNGATIEPSDTHKNILKELMKSVTTMKKMKDTDIKYWNDQIRLSKSRQQLFVVILVLFVIGFLVMAILAIKQNDVDIVTRVKNIILLMIVMNVVILLYGILSRYMKSQINKFKSEKDKIQNAVTNYENLFYDGIGMSKRIDIQNICARLTTNPPKTDKKPSNEIEFIKSWWYSDNTKVRPNDADKLIRIVKNVYAKGTGVMKLKLIETKSSNIKRLSGVNDILGYYYGSILRSLVAPDDGDNTNDKVLKMVDVNLISQLRNLNIMGLYDDRTDKDDVLKRKMETGERFKRILAGFQYFIYYMYLVRRMTPYELSSDIIGKKQMATTPEVQKVKSLLTRYKSIEYVMDRYPITAKALDAEQTILSSSGTSTDDIERKGIIEKFIQLTLSTFQNIHNGKAKDLFQNLNALRDSDVSAIKQTLRDFTRNFNDYFSTLYNDFIEDEFRNLNATGAQYLMFDNDYIHSLLDPLFNKVPFATLGIEEADDSPRYKEIVYPLVDDLIATQKDKFRSTYFKYEQEQEPSSKLKTAMFQDKLQSVMDTIITNLISKNVQLKNYTQYIVSSLVDKNNVYAPSVQVKIEEIIAKIDFEVAKKKKEVKKSDDPLETRFIEQNVFVSNLDESSFSTFTKSLQLERLKDLLEFQENDYKEAFVDTDYNIDIGQWTFKSFAFISSMLFAWYAAATVPSVYEMYKEKGIKTDVIFAAGTRLILPMVSLLLFLSIFNSYVTKASANAEYNKDIMRENTNAMKEEADNLYKLLVNVQSSLNTSDMIAPIGSVSSISDDSKRRIYNSMKNMLIAYDKCNYVVGNARYDVPFPYAEVFANGLMVVIIVCMMVYVMSNFTPIQRIIDIKDLYEYRETAATLANDVSFIQEVTAKAEISESNVEKIMGVTKIIIAVGIIVFMLVYTVKILDSNKEYPYALRNKERNNFAKNNLCVRT